MPHPVDALLHDAGRRSASDLVLEPQDDGSLVARARIEGVYGDLGRLSGVDAASAIARLKALAALPAYLTDEPQDGRIDGRPFAIPGDLRLACLPTVRGERLALRLPSLGALPTPAGLGLPPPVVAALRAALRRSDGLVVVTGPTGSGKTTTIHSLLTELAAERPDRQVVTIEDPVERRLPGVAQVAMRPERKLDWGQALAAVLRQDVDVLVVGEVRDGATATASLRAALTGHLVVTTLHTARAVDVAPRLIEMGCDADLLLPALSVVLTQRLIRLMHQPCAGRGCADCHGGYLGRRAVADLLIVDAAARAAWRAGRPPALAHDLDEQARDLVSSGATSSAEQARIFTAQE